MTKAVNISQTERLYEKMLSVEDSYTEDAKRFVEFLKNHGYGIYFEGLKAYAVYLDSDKGGKRLSANTYNKRINGAKKRLRYLFAYSPQSFDLLKRYQFEEALKEVKLKKTNSAAVHEEEILSQKEVEQLIAESSESTITLMIEFLYKTGLRITEMLNILLSDMRADGEKFIITVRGKGGKERKVYVGKELVERVRDYFNGKRYLFEHDGRQYSRVSVTNRIKKQSRVILGKDISAHTLRHSFATHMLKKTNNLKGVSKYLGHSSTSTTADLYVHSELKWEDIVGE